MTNLAVAPVLKKSRARIPIKDRLGKIDRSIRYHMDTVEKLRQRKANIVKAEQDAARERLNEIERATNETP
jgi:hypothetical protein